MFPPNCCRWPLVPVSFFRLRPSFIAPSSYPLYFYPASLVISLQNSIACLVLLVIFLVEVAITHIVSLGSIIIAALYPVLTLCYWLWKGTDAASLVFITVCCVLMGAYVIWLHRSNIQRLKNGTEYRFGEKKKENQ